ncbi:MAG TPA: discoidin domain-containing protein [Rhizomicrobium sp.]|nr:discoidin domain-containing protein [Rhizomicrobium sp.]
MPKLFAGTTVAVVAAAAGSVGLLALFGTTAAEAHPRHVRPQPLPPAVFPAPTTAPYPVIVDADPAHVLNRFSPDAAFGAGVDSVPFHAVPEIYTHSNVRQMLGAGFAPVSYRLYTELSVQDWHWNPAGRWSGPGNRGYWTSDTRSAAPIVDSYGYRLPRRGFTHDQGNDDNYSRLDDGDLRTFWKSNPYLERRYTGDPDGEHPQWVVYDLGARKSVNAAKIHWADPYAVRYAVQYWTGDDPIYDPAHGQWASFPNGEIRDGAGGTVTLRLGDAPKNERYLRIVMWRGSGTCTSAGSADPRDCVGYAIREAGFGTLAKGIFHDLVTHEPNRRQTVTYASSVDPWHEAGNRVRDQEQPGLDIVFQSGITRNIPATVPVPMLYSTPENAAAEIRYLETSGYAIARVEMGEEPDGQYVAPEDDAALYAQFADALHAVDHGLVLGGPVFENNTRDVKAWADRRHPETSWTKRFVAWLAAHGHLGDLGFFSFEHYPFGSCDNDREEANLLREPDLVSDIVAIWRRDDLPPGLPMYITETNYSQNETDAAQDVAGALWYAEMIGSLLATGSNGAFFYEYEPIPLSPAYPCRGWGTYGVLEGDKKYRAGAPLSQYFAAQMVTQDWTVPGDGVHGLYPVIGLVDPSWVTAWPVKRPDGFWSLLLVNRDFADAHAVTVQFATRSGPAWFSGNVTETEFGPAQYAWIVDGRHSYANPDGPPSTTQLSGGEGVRYTLPAESLTVLTGKVASQ